MKSIVSFLLLVSSAMTSLASARPSSIPLRTGNLKPSSTQGIALGYKPAVSSGLNLSLSAGTAYCDGSIQSYGGGVLTMKAGTTNYLYLTPSSSCGPTVSASVFPAAVIPIATVVTGTSTITKITDMRAVFISTGISGTGACASNQFVSAVNSATGPTCAQPSFSNLSGAATASQLPQATSSAPGTVQLAGDLGGAGSAPTVSGLQGNAVSATAPTTNQALTWNGTAWTPANPPVGAGTGVCTTNQFVTGNNSGSAPTCAQPSFSNLSGTASAAQLPTATGATPGTVQLAGDLGGTAATPTVSRLQGNAVSATAPTANQVLTWNGTAWTPSTPSSGSTTFVGDLSGSSSSQTVVGLQGRALASAAPSTNQVLAWNGSAWAPGALSNGGASLSAANTWTATQTFATDELCKSQRPCVDVVAEGADPTSRNASDAAFAAAESAFSGKGGGTIVGCGTFRLTQPWVITNPGLRVKSNCGASGSALQGAQRGGFVIESTTNSAIPVQTSTPSISGAAGGSLTAGSTYYIETTLVNGFGETTPSPTVSIDIPTGDTAIKITNVQYESGGFAYNVYCSTDGTNFYKQTSSDFESDSGTNAGPPFLVDLGNVSGPVLSTCATSGTTAPTSNSSTDANTLIQVGTSANEVSGGPEFDNVYFYDPDHVLGAGMVIVGAQRSMCYRCSFEGFTAEGTSPGGEAGPELGGIAYAVLDASTSSNFNSLIEPEFYSFELGILLEGSDTTIWGGDLEVAQNSSVTNGVGFDYPAGNLRMYGTHFSLNGQPTATAGIIRGNSRATHYGGIFSIKAEQAQGAQVLKLQYAEDMIINQQCEGNSSTTCLTFDSHSTYNIAQIVAVPSAIAFSDGTTSCNDPSDSNMIVATGSRCDGVYVNGAAKLVASGTPSGSCKNGSTYSNTSGGSGSTFYVCVAGAWVDLK